MELDRVYDSLASELKPEWGRSLEPLAGGREIVGYCRKSAVGKVSREEES
jgi:hypothetical protein